MGNESNQGKKGETIVFRSIIVMVLAVAIGFSSHVYSKMSVSSYDVNSAVRMTTQASSINPSSVIATSENETLSVLGFWFVNSGLQYDDDVVVMRVAFNNFLFDSADGSVVVDDLNLVSDVVAELKGDPLFYPNPLRFSEGGMLQYILSKPMDIEIHMYDIFGRRIYKKVCPANSSCGHSNVNEISFNEAELGGYELKSKNELNE